MKQLKTEALDVSQLHKIDHSLSKLNDIILHACFVQLLKAIAAVAVLLEAFDGKPNEYCEAAEQCDEQQEADDWENSSHRNAPQSLRPVGCTQISHLKVKPH